MYGYSKWPFHENILTDNLKLDILSRSDIQYLNLTENEDSLIYRNLQMFSQRVRFLIANRSSLLQRASQRKFYVFNGLGKNINVENIQNLFLIYGSKPNLIEKILLRKITYLEDLEIRKMPVKSIYWNETSRFHSGPRFTCYQDL